MNSESKKKLKSPKPNIQREINSKRIIPVSFEQFKKSDEEKELLKKLKKLAKK